MVVWSWLWMQFVNVGQYGKENGGNVLWFIPDFWYLSPNVVFFPYRQNYWCEWYSLVSRHQPMLILSPWAVDPMSFSMYKYQYFRASVFFLCEKMWKKCLIFETTFFKRFFKNFYCVWEKNSIFEENNSKNPIFLKNNIFLH